MRGQTHNLTTKNISDFKAGDSIYATVKSGDMHYTYECEFIENVDSHGKLILRETKDPKFDSVLERKEN